MIIETVLFLVFLWIVSTRDFLIESPETEGRKERRDGLLKREKNRERKKERDRRSEEEENRDTIISRLYQGLSLFK